MCTNAKVSSVVFRTAIALLLLCQLAYLCYIAIQPPFDVANLQNRRNANNVMINESTFFEWKTLTNGELSAYFTDYEILSMNKSNPQCNIQQYQCCIGAFSTGGVSKWQTDSGCFRSHVNYQQIPQYQTMQRTFNMHDIFWRLANNSRLIIIGDSVQHQLFHALHCDLLRHNFPPFLRHNGAVSLLHSDTKINFTLLSPSWSQSRFENTQTVKFRYNFHKLWNHTYIGHHAQDNSTHIVSIIFFRMHRPYLPIFNELCHWGDVIVYGWDLHYDSDVNEPLWYTEIGDGILNITAHCLRHGHMNNIQMVRKSPIFVWRETSTQHFGKIGGYWSDVYRGKEVEQAYRKRMSVKLNNSALWSDRKVWMEFYDSQLFMQHHDQCIPLNFYKNESLERYLWRNRLTKYVNRSLNNSLNVEIVYPLNNWQTMRQENTLYYIPFKDVTDPLWNLHRASECTHFCRTPYLFSFVWDVLYRVIDVNTASQSN